MRKFVFGVWCLCFGPLLAQEQSGLTVKAAGLRLLWEFPDKDVYGHSALLNGQEPVAVALHIQGGGKKLVSFDDSASKLTSLEDDQGTVIKGRIGDFPKMASDGSGAYVELSGEVPVSPEARVLRAKGLLVFDLASKKSTRRSKIAPLKKKAKFEVSKDLVFEIEDHGKPSWGDDPLEIELKIKRDISEVAEVRFYDQDGKLIESKRAGSMRMAFGKKVTISRTYNLKRKADQMSIAVDLWTDMERVSVPFDLKLGVGGARER